MNYGPILGVLKYAGIGIATLSSVWSATNVVSREVDGRKRLTRAGKIAVGFTMLGLAVTVTSSILQDRAASQAAEERAIAELRRTNRIILAGQPLASLDFTWEFDRIGRHTLQSVDSAALAAQEEQRNKQGGTTLSQAQVLWQEMVLYPFLSSLVTRRFGEPQQNVIVLLSLDPYSNAILPFGFLGDSILWNRNEASPAVDSALSGSVLYRRDFGGAMYGASSRRQDEVRNVPVVRHHGDSLAVRWILDPVTFAHVVDRQNAATPLTANLPDRMSMLILYDVRDLPFAPGNFASPRDFEPWSRNSYSPAQDTAGVDVELLARSTLTLVPNELADQAARYAVSRVSILEGSGAEAADDIECRFVLIELAKVDP